MSNQSNGRKISQFLGLSSLPSDAYLTFISNGVNYKISLADFIASLGVTGTIVQDGAVSGVPILDIAGAVNNIRNVEAGSGIYAAVSPENGLTLKHNFLADTGGVKLVTDFSVDQPVFRSLVAGSGINVSASGDEITVALSSTPASSKTIIVNSISDFPTPISGVITLNDDTEYYINQSISTANRFVLGNNNIISASDNISVNFTYTGSGNMFTSANKNVTFKDITLTCASGTLFSWAGSGSEVLQLLNCKLVVDTLGTISDIYGLYVSGSQLFVTTDGFSFSGTCGVALIDGLLSSIDAGTLIDLTTSTFDGFTVNDVFITLNGTSYFLDGAASSANINADGLGSVHNCRFFGTGTPLNTISVADIRWQFFINDAIVDSTFDCLMSMIGNATATTIAAASTPVKVAGTWTEEHKHRFTTDATGKMTYVGEKGVEINVNFALTMEPASGTTKDLAAYVYLNGVQVANSKASAILSAGTKERVSLVWRLTLAKNDYIEVYVENNSDTVDILVSDAVMRLS